MARVGSPAALAALVVLGLAAPARAHQQTATFGEVTQGTAAGLGAKGSDAGAIVWRLRVRAVDLVAALKAQAGPPGAPDATVQNRRRAAYLQAGLHVTADDRPCAAGTPSLTLDPADVELEPTFVFVESFACPAGWTALRLRYDLFFEADRFHESFTRLTLATPALAAQDRESLSTIVFRAGLREVSLAGGDGPSIWRSAFVYLRLGIFHILTGYDHLSFLMALLLGAALCRYTTAKTTAAAASIRQALRGTVAVISAFTVAHSLTLMVQVLRPGWLPTRWVEPAIAFSVAYVGFENLIPRPPRRRWLLVFGFGLVHGLGFASVLREIGLPRRGLVLSLVSFNLGVEIGQLLVLALTFPLIVGAARRNPRRFERWGLRLGSAVIAAFGTVWLIARLVVNLG
jgi:hydrogenase/urease accessory protein HupE